MLTQTEITASIQQRREKQKRVKKKISEILENVREQKQHIENQLGRNDMKIRLYCEQYEQLRYQHDFTELSEKQTIILKSIIEGLLQSKINPTNVLGEQVSQIVQLCQKEKSSELDLLSKDSEQQLKKEYFPRKQSTDKYQKLEKTQILRVQNDIIKSLLSQIQKNQVRKIHKK